MRDPRESSESPLTTAEPGWTVVVVQSVYEREITDRLAAGASRAWRDAGGASTGLRVIEAPGSFELPQLAQDAATSGATGVVTLGCLIRGETRHDEYIASAVAQGVTRVALDTGVPVAFGVITANTRSQAVDRSLDPDEGGKGNKGYEAMAACLAAISAKHALRSEAVGRS